MTTTSPKRYARPRIFSAPVPLVEELLAVGYRTKAQRWADQARARREVPAGKAARPS